MAILNYRRKVVCSSGEKVKVSNGDGPVVGYATGWTSSNNLLIPSCINYNVRDAIVVFSRLVSAIVWCRMKCVVNEFISGRESLKIRARATAKNRKCVQTGRETNTGRFRRLEFEIPSTWRRSYRLSPFGLQEDGSGWCGWVSSCCRAVKCASAPVVWCWLWWFNIVFYFSFI